MVKNSTTMERSQKKLENWLIIFKDVANPRPTLYKIHDEIVQKMPKIERKNVDYDSSIFPTTSTAKTQVWKSQGQYKREKGKVEEKVSLS